jgi:hypothetical protein
MKMQMLVTRGKVKPDTEGLSLAAIKHRTVQVIR